MCNTHVIYMYMENTTCQLRIFMYICNMDMEFYTSGVCLSLQDPVLNADQLHEKVIQEMPTYIHVHTCVVVGNYVYEHMLFLHADTSIFVMAHHCVSLSLCLSVYLFCVVYICHVNGHS